MTKKKTFNLTIYELTLYNGLTERRVLTPHELAALKRSNEAKHILSIKKLSNLEIRIKY